ncbi:hypothetical protein FRB98_006022 [Tulasnella sp. 332]|nr:hypothetical protein FRB98_006022 [Tulasnella sp. 332]
MSSSSSRSNVPPVTLAGVTGEDVSQFLHHIEHESFQQGRQRDNTWIADYALTLLRGRALMWYYRLDEESQSSWRRLRLAIVNEFGAAHIPLPSSPMPVSAPMSVPTVSELFSPPPQYTAKDPLAQTIPTQPEQPRPGINVSVPRQTQSMSSGSRALATPPAQTRHSLNDSSVSRSPSPGQGAGDASPAVRFTNLQNVIVPLIPARKGYIKLVTSAVGTQRDVGYIGMGKRWNEIKRSRSKALYIEVPASRTAHQAFWEMKIIDPTSETRLERQGLHVRGPITESTAITGFTWSFIRETPSQSSKVYMIWRRCWAMHGDRGEEEFSIMWRYKDGSEQARDLPFLVLRPSLNLHLFLLYLYKIFYGHQEEDTLKILEKRGMFSSDGLMLRSQNHKPGRNEVPLIERPSIIDIRSKHLSSSSRSEVIMSAAQVAHTANPFTPLLTSKPTHSPSESSQNVTIPHLPELFSTESLDKLMTKIASGPVSTKKVADQATHPFATAMKEAVNLTRTDNMAPAFVSTESKTLDAFSTLDPNVKKGEIHSLLRESWVEDPETTLRIIWNLRSIHDGKAAKTAFYSAFGWLYAKHPKTAIANLYHLVDQVVEKKFKPKKEGKSKEEKDGKGDTKMESADDDEWTEVKEGDAAAPKKDAELMVPVGMTHGYYKDLLNILVLAATDQLTHPDVPFTALHSPRPDNTAAKGGERARRRNVIQTNKAESRKRIGKEATAEKTAKEMHGRQSVEAERAKEHRTKAAADAHKKLLKKLADDAKFKALYVTIARIFARALSEDVKILQKIADPSTAKEEKHQLKWHITLAGKWAPTLCGSHDRLTNIGTAIALAMYASGDMAGLPQIRLDAPVTEVDAEKVRSFYRRWVVSPLRRYAEIPEVMMSANKWDKINYSHIASASFGRNKKAFFKHDEGRLMSYLQDVAKGKKSISGATLGPHELVQEAINLTATGKKGPIEARLNEVSISIVNNQWNTMIERLREAGTLDNCIAVCDVSGSMGGISASPKRKKSQTDFVQPILPAISLTLVLATLAKPPFNNTFITFHSTPEIVTIPTSAQTDLASAVQQISEAKWGMNTDFNAVFTKLILPLAVANKLKREEMVKRVFVFSDMQFDCARQEAERQEGIAWDTCHEQIVKEFEDAGYDVPEIVYWNLSGRATAAKPITKDTPGVAMVSGFSGNLLKVFMEKDEIPEEEWMDIVDEEGNTVAQSGEKAAKVPMTPEDIMNKALGMKSYEGLKVLD